MRYVFWLALYTYGILFHISSSEFWPVTISKTWFTPAAFEYSMLQKPLLTMFLAVFHLFPLSDTIHVFLVKTVFAVFGIAGLTYFSHFVLELTGFASKKIHKSDLAALMAFTLVCVSPVIRNNFFNIRSDQMAFLCFSCFLLFCIRKHLWMALACLILIPCFGVKEIIFLLPGAIYFYWTFRSTFTSRIIFYGLSTAVTILVWLVALNPGSLSYLILNLESADYAARFGASGLQSELALLFLSVGAISWIFVNRTFRLYAVCGLSLAALFLMLALPQANSFFFASILPVALLPLLALMIDSKIWTSAKATLVALSIIWAGGYTLYHKQPWHYSNYEQLWFIEMASKIVSANNFTYLDGQGILPRQKLVPCFVSPDDDNANNNCQNQLLKNPPDALIITNRLLLLGEGIFRFAEQRYIQIYPNFWILKEKMNSKLAAKIDLSASRPLPVILF